jgi:hypothetical protein
MASVIYIEERKLKGAHLTVSVEVLGKSDVSDIELEAILYEMSNHVVVLLQTMIFGKSDG